MSSDDQRMTGATEATDSVLTVSEIDSNGVFAKRRRNLLTIGVIIIFLALLKPKVDEIVIFGVEFDFTRYYETIWIMLGLWLLYAAFRAYAYYNTYLKLVKYSWNEYIYWRDSGKRIWNECAERGRRNLINKLKNESPSIVDVVFEGDIKKKLKDQVRTGEIPGNGVRIYFLIKNVEGLDDELTSEDIDFNIPHNMNKYFKKRKNKRFYFDDWWEYKFVVFFALFSVGFWIFGFLQSLEY